MPLPTFFIIGAAKAGTTSLYHYLDQHPDIYMSPNKEPQFFAYEGREIPAMWEKTFGVDGIVDLGQYRALFDAAKNETAVGEASTNYLHLHGTAQAIHRLVPNAKHIAILRNPVDRAYSHFNNLRTLGKEPERDFRLALAAEDARCKQGWHPVFQYSQFGFYGKQLREYYNVFGRDRICVFSYEEFRKSPYMLCQKAFTFLGVNPDFQPHTQIRYNVSGEETFYFRKVIRRLTTQANDLSSGERFIKSVARLVIPRILRSILAHQAQWGPRSQKSIQKLKKPPPISQELRASLAGIYRDDILATQELTGLDLSSWLEGSVRQHSKQKAGSGRLIPEVREC